MSVISFFDIEVNPDNKSIIDIGCVRDDDAVFHENSAFKFLQFVDSSEFLVGHNVLKHDLRYLEPVAGSSYLHKKKIIDTLFLSPLLFPTRPYHHLLKDLKHRWFHYNMKLPGS